MNIIKPLHSSLLYKTFSYQKKHIFTVSQLWGFRLDSGDSVLEQDLWTAISGALGKNQVFDLGYPKPRAEFLAKGSFFAPGGSAATAGNVSIELAGREKQLAIFGDRYWRRGAVTSPSTFTEMPLDYEHAFGGSTHAQNPIGRGIDSMSVEGEDLIPLPNIEDLNRLVGAPGDRPAPASFDSIDVMWEPRITKAGTYDQHYVETQMPDFADDIEFAYFNDAAEDQQFPQYLIGNETFRITGMNEDMAHIAGQLPGVYGRSFVNQEIDGKIVFKEIKTNLDTVWFFPADNLGIVIHRGSLESSDIDGKDIKQLLCAHEFLTDPPRTVEHYQTELSQRIDPEEGIKHVMNSLPLIPEGMRCGYKLLLEENDLGLEMLQSQNLTTFSDNKKAELEQQQLDQINAMRARAIETDGNSDQIDKMLADFEKAKADGVEDTPEAARLKEILNKVSPGIVDNPQDIDIGSLNLKALDELQDFRAEIEQEKRQQAADMMQQNIDDLRSKGEDKQADNLLLMRAKMDLPPILPRVNVEEIMQPVRAQQQEIEKQMLILRSSGMPEEDIKKNLPDIEAIEQQLKDASLKAREAYCMGAHLQGKASSPHEGRETNIRDQLLTAFRQSGQTADGDYAFVDLSNQDLRGIDLSHAYLEYADLSHSDLSDANLSHAILCHAKFDNTTLVNTNLRGANLGGGKIENAHFEKADFSDASLGKAQLINSKFINCKMAEKMDLLLECEFDRVDFSGTDLRKNVFIDREFNQCIFNRADFTESNFVNPVFVSCSFNETNLGSVNIVKAKAHNNQFKQAQLEGVPFLGGCDIAGSVFESANANKACFRDCNLQDCNFDMASIEEADFGNANARNASFKRAQAYRAQFSNTDLSLASLERINLLEGSFRQARLSGASFKDASLYGVDFYDCTIGETDFSGADLTKTIFKDWRPS